MADTTTIDNAITTTAQAELASLQTQSQQSSINFYFYAFGAVVVLGAIGFVIYLKTKK